MTLWPPHHPHAAGVTAGGVAEGDMGTAIEEGIELVSIGMVDISEGLSNGRFLSQQKWREYLRELASSVGKMIINSQTLNANTQVKNSCPPPAGNACMVPTPPLHVCHDNSLLMIRFTLRLILTQIILYIG